MCFNILKNNNKWSWLAEIKSVPIRKCISPKQINLTIATKNNAMGILFIYKYLELNNLFHCLYCFVHWMLYQTKKYVKK